jgi:hypothetical protein
MRTPRAQRESASVIGFDPQAGLVRTIATATDQASAGAGAERALRQDPDRQLRHPSTLVSESDLARAGRQTRKNAICCTELLYSDADRPTETSRQKENPTICGAFLQAAEGTRTLDLLHGKQVIGL